MSLFQMSRSTSVQSQQQRQPGDWCNRMLDCCFGAPEEEKSGYFLDTEEESDEVEGTRSNNEENDRSIVESRQKKKQVRSMEQYISRLNRAHSRGSGQQQHQQQSETQTQKQTDNSSLTLSPNGASSNGNSSMNGGSQIQSPPEPVVTNKIRERVFAKPVLINSEFRAPNYDKTNEQRVFLSKVLQQNFLFDDLSETERALFINALQPEQVPIGHVIIQQGDENGDFFYIVEAGIVNFVDGTKVVGNCSKGECFGELALLYNSPRAVSCIAASDKVLLWKLDQSTFRHLMANHANDREQEVKGTLNRVSLFKNLDEAARLRLVDSFTTVNWKAGERIVYKGQEGNVFYIVKDGKVKIHDIGLGDSQFEDQILGPGEWFGERALLTGEPRAANVTAISNVSLLAVDRETFECTLGSLKGWMDREMRKQFLRGLPIFAKSDITREEIDQMVDSMSEACYRKGTKLFERGKALVSNLFFIRHGQVIVYSGLGDINNLETGDYFGDNTIKPKPDRESDQTVVCETDVTAWVLPRDAIEAVIGDMGRLGMSMTLAKAAEDKSILPSDLTKRRVLGKGAFGKVWLVSHNDKKASYALKEISKYKLLKSNQEKSIIREKEFLRLLNHPFILSLVSSFQDSTNVYLLLPLVPGGELFSVVQKQKTAKRGLPAKNAGFYGACIIEALGHFHQRSIAYRDLKLENAMIDAEGYCKIVDLGFAKIVNDKTYTLVGTPEYLAPEVIMSKGHGVAVDYWAFGVLVFELLTGGSPFYVEGTSQIDMFKRIVSVRYEFPPYVDDLVKAMIQKLLVRKPSKRLGNMAKGYLDVKQHVWFMEMGIDFPKLLRKELEAPWNPVVKDPLDASNFDDFRHLEHDEVPQGRITKEQQKIFAGF